MKRGENKVKREENKEKEGGNRQARVLWTFRKSSLIFYNHNFYLFTAHSVSHISINANYKPQYYTYLTNIL